jgi:hypothetical protein
VLASLLRAAARGLDLIAVSGGSVYGLDRAVEEHIVYWPIGGHLEIAWTGTRRTRIGGAGKTPAVTLLLGI